MGGLLFFLFFMVVIGSVVAKVSTARSMARKAGLDEGAATAAALFDSDGLSATYLASSLRGHAAPRPSAETRLRELRRLLDEGLVTQVEYDERRRHVLEEL